LGELFESRQGEELAARHDESHEQFEPTQRLRVSERHERLGEGDELAALERFLECR
jgi:hypothetical protein